MSTKLRKSAAVIHKSAGSRIDWLEPSRDKRVGIERSRVRGSRLLAGDADLRVVVSHRETVVDVPRGYQATASRPGVPNDGLEHDSLDIFSYQFHPEAREQFATRSGIIAAAEIDANVRADSRRVLDAFRQLCQSD